MRRGDQVRDALGLDLPDADALHDRREQRLGGFVEQLRGGERNGYRLLSPAMIELASRNHTGEMSNSLLDYVIWSRNWLPWPAYHGLGLFVRGAAARH